MSAKFAKLGVVGCGSHATHNILPMLKYARCRLDAVCDLDEGLAERNAMIYGAAAVHTDADQMLAERNLDGVIVVGPPQMHYAVGKKALERGIPVFTEKPPALDLQSVEEMIGIAKKQGAFLMTGYMKRHGLAYLKAKELITSGQFELASGQFKYGHWKMTDLRAMLLGMSSHPIDLAISFFGEVVSVQATTRKSERAISLSVVLTFASGKWAQLWLDSSQPRIQERVELSGAMDGGNALIIVDNVQHMELHKEGHHGIDLLAPQLDEIAPSFNIQDIQLWRPDYGIPNMGQTRHFFQGFAGEIREFVDAILDKREPDPGTDDASKAMRVIEAICLQPNGLTVFDTAN